MDNRFKTVSSILILLSFANRLTATEFARKKIPDFIYGITTDNGYDSVDLPLAIKALSRPVCVRMVFDENIPPEDYLASASALHDVSCVMGLVVDSSSITAYSPTRYVDRQRRYFETLRDKVDIWEIGNEINGSWTGLSSEVIKKLEWTFDLAKQFNLTTALTLYYNTPCENNSDREMFSWSKKNIDERVKRGLDFVFLSYYNDDCPAPQQDWDLVFSHLADIFPQSKVGFGEVGTASSIASKKRLIKYYYELSKPGVVTTPRFVGGYFYWYFYQDMVPKTKALWSYFDKILSSLP